MFLPVCFTSRGHYDGLQPLDHTICDIHISIGMFSGRLVDFIQPARTNPPLNIPKNNYVPSPRCIQICLLLSCCLQSLSMSYLILVHLYHHTVESELDRRFQNHKQLYCIVTVMGVLVFDNEDYDCLWNYCFCLVIYKLDISLLMVLQ